MKNLLDSNNQLDFAHQMELHGEAEREMEIRRIAREYAEKPIPPDDYLGMPVVVHMGSPTAVYVAPNATPPISSMSFHGIHLKVHPAIQGPARIIIAEAQIREQLEVDDLL